MAKSAFSLWLSLSSPTERSTVTNVDVRVRLHQNTPARAMTTAPAAAPTTGIRTLADEGDSPESGPDAVSIVVDGVLVSTDVGTDMGLISPTPDSAAKASTLK
eukprot:3517421-Rhodomonas_salina.1